MLKSVYKYGGFWIGRYEAGIERSIDDISKARTSHTNVEIGTSPKAISQKDAIPYNYVYCSEAELLAREMMQNSNYTSSLMFGIQWDLVCKFLEVKSKSEIANINLDSGTWGNYSNVTIAITSDKAKKEGTPWNKITETKAVNSKILLTTGASNETKKMNIYDFAGNEWEWTLEKTSDSIDPSVYRGGSYLYSGSDYPASYRVITNTTAGYGDSGFRTTFYAN